MIKPALILISPEWDPELEEIIPLTRDYFDLKILTQKQTLLFNDPFIEILQCFETYSLLELGRLLPWILQQTKPQIHLCLPPHADAKILLGLGSLLSIMQSLPGVKLTHSPWGPQKVYFQIWFKTFGPLFAGCIPSPGRRSLSSNVVLHPTSKELLPPKELQQKCWVFPFSDNGGWNSHWDSILALLLEDQTNIVEFWNWDILSFRQQNIIRARFGEVWWRFRFRSPRRDLQDWEGVHFLVLIGEGKNLQFSELDLLDLAIQQNLRLIIDAEGREKLQGPWIENLHYWLWNSLQNLKENLLPWTRLPWPSNAEALLELKRYKDQRLNGVLRSLIRLDFPSQSD